MASIADKSSPPCAVHPQLSSSSNKAVLVVGWGHHERVKECTKEDGDQYSEDSVPHLPWELMRGHCKCYGGAPTSRCAGENQSLESSPSSRPAWQPATLNMPGHQQAQLMGKGSHLLCQLLGNFILLVHDPGANHTQGRTWGPTLSHLGLEAHTNTCAHRQGQFQRRRKS